MKLTFALIVLLFVSAQVGNAQPRPRPSPQPREITEAAQNAAIRRLRSASSKPVELQMERGVLRSATLDIRVPARVGGDGHAKARWFLNEYRAALRLPNPSTDLQLARRSDDDKFLFFRRLHRGIPIFPGGIGVHLNGSRVWAVGGNYVAKVDVSPAPRLTAARAEEIAKREDKRAKSVLGDTSLRYVNPGLLGLGDRVTRLAWRVNLNTFKTMYIDAHSGKLIYTSSHVNEGFDLELDNSNRSPFREGAPCGGEERWFEEGGPVSGASPDTEGWLAFNNIRNVDAYFRNTFGRDGYDGDGDDVEMYVHVGNENGGPWRDAQYLGGWCDIFEFGDGYPVNDVVGHEFTHGVINNSSVLEYANESGALNESFADIFGQFMDNSDWLIGEDIPNRDPLRDMAHPPIDHYGEKRASVSDPNDDNDHGWVHRNSGINNKAAFLITAGGPHNSFNIRGIGQRKSQQLFYFVMTSYLWDCAHMIDARNGAVRTARSWADLRLFDFTANDVCQVRNAYAAVGLGEGDADCDGTLDSEDALTDSDGDGVGDSGDNCPGVDSPGQWDEDGDGIGDLCDSDKDDDGIPDVSDNCDYTQGSNQNDFDNDGFGDICDNGDIDAHMDAVDNCPTIANDDQLNTDGDSQGDVCDTNDDNDNLNDTFDNCDLVPNNDQKDTDRDRVGDKCDLCPTVSSPDNNDTDGDGDGDPCDDDIDGDGVPNNRDNCDYVPNPNQSDLNNNGVGSACDPEDRKILQEIAMTVEVSREPFLIPVPVCPDCGLTIPNSYEQVVRVEAPVGFDVRIVDSEGRSVADGQRAAGRHVLRFQPRPFGSSAFKENFLGGGTGTQRRLPVDKPAAHQLRYYLMVTPSRGTELKSYRLGFQFQRGVRQRGQQR
ncbi:MAG TPA: M4 family metallopeptidase [Pyrinomonadaceae bacterium]|nr:M4 family metallopeptidase [Pyrinomonadaceae bacterium]